MPEADVALRRLIDGNKRFAAGLRSVESMMSHARRPDLLGGQRPMAIVLGCSDSRVPLEIVFDQGLGDLFVIRVAGNIVAPSQVGSVEFAAAQYGIKLVVVLGHSHCGAVTATVEALRSPRYEPSPNIRAIVDRIRPAVEGLLHTDLRDDHPRLIAESVRANVRASTDHLRHGSPILEEMASKDELAIVGAEYSLETGVVDFFDLPAGFAAVPAEVA